MITLPAFLSPTQTGNARLILRHFILAGYPLAVGIAAVVNAKAESNLDHNAIGDGGASIGLFQLSQYGAGRGMTAAARQDPSTNTRTILAEVRRYGGAMMDAVQAGQPVAEISAIFSRDIERPADQQGAMATRRQLTHQLFPGLAAAPANMLPPGILLLPALLPAWSYAAVGGGVGLLIVLGIVLTRR